ncbi:MAG TPA: excinuclease ABC subunit UvrC [Candidatus Thermoplasmatota archaeon]|nr:excinuclease ABC subunit UvrC [Candidatus Thermoplasmatota archaeon]
MGLPIVLADVPDEPGVYLLKDLEGKVLYVGKAARLRARLASYRPQDVEARKLPLLERTAAVEILLTRSEKEALLLESGLVQRHRPRYNVRLTDDKRYPYIRITDDPWPRVMIVRDTRGRGRHFGPFPDAGAARLTMQVVREAFKLRDCRELIPGGCLNFQMELCWAPCVEDAAERVRKVGDTPLARADVPATYAEGASGTLAFLRGDLARVGSALRAEMEAAAEDLRFERAATLRDRIEAVRTTLERQAVFSRDKGDVDVFVVEGPAPGGLAVGLVILSRGGSVAGQEHFFFREAAGRAPADLLTEFVQRYYEHMPSAPGEILVPETMPAQDALALVLAEKRRAPVVVTVPRRGDRLRLLELARKNAAFRLQQELLRRGERDFAEELEAVRAALDLRDTPSRIECFDVSHLDGTGVVGSMTVAVDARSRTSEYRRFKVKVDANDDVAAMKEIVGRRYARLLEEAPREKAEGTARWPSLVLIDGGPTQLKAAAETLRALGLEDVPVAGISKHRSRPDAADEVWVPGRIRPTEVAAPGLRLLMRVRDEAHRFALQYQRRRRKMSMTRSALDDLPGVGPARKRALLAAFGSPEGVLRAPEGELARVPGIGPSVAQSIRAWIDARPTP